MSKKESVSSKESIVLEDTKELTGKHKTVKPIFIIKIPSFCISTERGNEIKDNISKSGVAKDYHVLVFLDDVEKIECELFYVKDFNHVKFEELVKMINEDLNNLVSGDGK